VTAPRAPHKRNRATALMRKSRALFGRHPTEKLAALVGCDVRTAERYFARDRAPEAATLVALLRSDIGPRLVEEATRDLPPAEHARFWREMAKATLRASLRDEPN